MNASSRCSCAFGQVEQGVAPPRDVPAPGGQPHRRSKLHLSALRAGGRPRGRVVAAADLVGLLDETLGCVAAARQGQRHPDLIVIDLAVHAIGAQEETISGAHRDRQHVDPEGLVLEADEGGEPVQGHAAITVLTDVETGGEEFRPHVVVVGEQVQARPVVEVGKAVGAASRRGGSA